MRADRSYICCFTAVVVMFQGIYMGMESQAFAAADMREADIKAQIGQRRQRAEPQRNTAGHNIPPAAKRGDRVYGENYAVPSRRFDKKAAPNGAAAAERRAVTGKTAESFRQTQSRTLSAETESRAHGVLNGYKGYRYRRAGYKTTGDGWWYPRAAFARNAAKTPFMQKTGRGTLKKTVLP